MRFYTKQHQFYCGIDLHARTMYVCIMDHEGTILIHRNMPATAETLADVLQPYREDLALAVECIFNWYWVADLCNCISFEFVLGHALYMKAINYPDPFSLSTISSFFYFHGLPRVDPP
jgi:hypothetical protein